MDAAAGTGHRAQGIGLSSHSQDAPVARRDALPARAEAAGHGAAAGNLPSARELRSAATAPCGPICREASRAGPRRGLREQPTLPPRGTGESAASWRHPRAPAAATPRGRVAALQDRGIRPHIARNRRPVPRDPVAYSQRWLGCGIAHGACAFQRQPHPDFRRRERVPRGRSRDAGRLRRTAKEARQSEAAPSSLCILAYFTQGPGTAGAHSRFCYSRRFDQAIGSPSRQCRLYRISPSTAAPKR